MRIVTRLPRCTQRVPMTAVGTMGASAIREKCARPVSSGQDLALVVAEAPLARDGQAGTRPQDRDGTTRRVDDVLRQRA